MTAKLLRDPRGIAGVVLALAVITIAVAGPMLAPHPATDIVGRPYSTPSAAAPLGTDVVGRDVLSIFLHGGQLFLAESVAAALIGVVIGAVWGMLQGLSRTSAVAVLVPLNDTAIVIPQILITLLVLTRFGASPMVLLTVVGLANVPHVGRVVRAATVRVNGQDYVAAARALGMGGPELMLREILPNIAGTVLVEVGIRLAASAVMIASLSYLGFGSNALDWGRVVHDNQGGVAVQPWAVVVPVAAISAFLIGVNFVRDAFSRAITARSAR